MNNVLLENLSFSVPVSLTIHVLSESTHTLSEFTHPFK